MPTLAFVLLLAALPAEGDVAKVTVTSVVDYGCFVKHASGWEGLIHITDLAWDRLNEASERCTKGKPLTVKVVKVKGERVSLSLKAMQPDPWSTAAERFRVGSTHPGKVVSIMEYGVFFELAPGVEALAHHTMLAQTKPGALVVGATFPVKVVDVDAAQRRISVEMVGDKRVVTPNAASTIDDLKELVPNLAASLSVLEPMAQAKKVDAEELKRARTLAGAVTQKLTSLCTGDGTKPDGCATARTAADTIGRGLEQPVAARVRDASLAAMALRDLVSGW